jgi:hypothetical protein
MSMQAADMAPTDAELAECAKQQGAYHALMAKWVAVQAEVGQQ